MATNTTTTSQSTSGPLHLGTMLWGAAGHFDQGGPYSSIPISQQIKASRTFSALRPIPLCTVPLEKANLPKAAQAEIQQLQSAGVIPVVMTATYPPFGSFSNQQDAYNWAYATTNSYAQGTPAAQIYESETSGISIARTISIPATVWRRQTGRAVPTSR